MKHFFKISKWIAGQLRPFVLSFISIILQGAVLSIGGIGIAAVSKRIIDAASLGDIKSAICGGIIFIVIIILDVLLEKNISISSARTLEMVSNNIRLNLFSRILCSKWMYMSKYHSGELITRLTRDIGMLSNVLVNIIPDMFSLGVQFVGAFILLLIYEPVLAVAALILGPAGVLFSRLFGRRLKRFHIKLQETESEYRSLMQESINNLFVVKAFKIEKKNISNIENIQTEELEYTLRKSRLSAGANAVLSTGYWIGYAIAFGWGVYLISCKSVTFGTFTAFIQLFGQVQGPFEGLAYKLPQLISAAASAERLMEFDALELENDLKEDVNWKSSGIEFKNVAFHYDLNKPVLRGISFKIYPGETVALVGQSGEGKTTIIRLILSFLCPDRGNIYFYNELGEKIECTPSCRSLISYVPQGNTLFSGTIRENLYLGNPEADEFELIRALMEASAWEFIEELPYRMETLIGERGIGLSEGQAQRIAIARALLRKTPILILDEATSALDMDTESRILEAIKNLKHKPACIIITHRESVIKMCTRVLKLNEGRITELNSKAISNPTDEAV